MNVSSKHSTKQSASQWDSQTALRRVAGLVIFLTPTALLYPNGYLTFMTCIMFFGPIAVMTAWRGVLGWSLMLVWWPISFLTLYFMLFAIQGMLFPVPV